VALVAPEVIGYIPAFLFLDGLPAILSLFFVVVVLSIPIDSLSH